MEAMSSSNSYPKKPVAPKPKAVAPKPVVAETEELIVADEVIVEVPEVTEAAVEVVEVANTEVSEKVEVPVIMAASPIALAPASPYAVVSGSATDAVHLSKIVFKNLYNKKSLSVHHLQRRLSEWGFSEAYLDKDGYYGDHTKNAIAAFQAKVSLPVTGDIDAATLKAVFENDNNVTVIID